MCMCTLLNVGMTVLPVRSTRTAPAGALTAPRTPTAVIRPFSTTNAPFSMGALASPMISRAPSYRTALLAYPTPASAQPRTVIFIIGTRSILSDGCEPRRSGVPAESRSTHIHQRPKTIGELRLLRGAEHGCVNLTGRQCVLGFDLLLKS